MISASYLTDVPIELLEELHRMLGEVMVVGAHARDLHLVAAGRPASRRTVDLDLAIAVSSQEQYERLLPDARRSANGMGVTVMGVAVDVIPFGGVGDENNVIEPTDGILLDVTGMKEAFDTALTVTLPSGGCVRVPTLDAMVVLKTVAWGMRRDREPKDAPDLRDLLGIAGGDDHVEVWEALDVGELVVQYDSRPELAACHQMGRRIALHFTPPTVERCTSLWVMNREALVADMRTGEADDLLQALVNGCGSVLDHQLADHGRTLHLPVRLPEGLGVQPVEGLRDR